MLHVHPYSPRQAQAQHVNIKRRFVGKNRAAIGLIAIAIASLWALSVSYDISRAEMLRFFLGSILTLLAAMLAAFVLVVVLKSVAMLVRKLCGGEKDNQADG